MALREVMERVMVATRLNTAFFAKTVTYRTGAGNELPLDAHVRHTIRQDHKPDGTSTVVEQIRVELNRAELETPPDFGDRILLADDDYGYVYAYAGRHTPVSWKGVFERKRRTAQSTGKSK